jgi:hypothetical protein
MLLWLQQEHLPHWLLLWGEPPLLLARQEKASCLLQPLGQAFQKLRAQTRWVESVLVQQLLLLALGLQLLAESRQVLLLLLLLPWKQVMVTPQAELPQQLLPSVQQ